MHTDILYEISGGITSRALYYFKQNIWGLVMHGYKSMHGDDLDENGNFVQRKLVTHGNIKFIGAFLAKIAIMKRGTYSRVVTKQCIWGRA